MVLGSSGLFKENKSISNCLDEIKETIDKIMENKKFILSLNTGMFVNRFTDYNKFSNFLKNYLKIDNVQLTSDFLMLNMDIKIFLSIQKKFIKH